MGHFARTQKFLLPVCHRKLELVNAKLVLFSGRRLSIVKHNQQVCFSARKLVFYYPPLQTYQIYAQVICNGQRSSPKTMTPSLERGGTFKKCYGLIFSTKCIDCDSYYFSGWKRTLVIKSRLVKEWICSHSASPVICGSLIFSLDFCTIVQLGLINQEHTNQNGKYFY